MSQKVWGSDGFLFFVMGIVLMMLALYVLTGEAVVRRGELQAVEHSLGILKQHLTQLKVQLANHTSSIPEYPKKRWWQR